MKVTITIDVPEDPNDPQRRALEDNCVLEEIESALVESGATFEWEDDTSTLVNVDELHRWLHKETNLRFSSQEHAIALAAALDANFTVHRR